MKASTFSRAGIAFVLKQAKVGKLILRPAEDYGDNLLVFDPTPFGEGA